MSVTRLMDSLDNWAGKPGVLKAVGTLVVLWIFLQGWFNPFYQGNVYDSYSYYFAAVAIDQGQNPYDAELLNQLGRVAGIERVYPYLYPPLLAGLWRPLTALSPDGAHLVTVLLNTGFLILTIFLIFDLVKPREHRRALYLLFLLFLPLNIGVEMTIRQGQINPLVMLGILGCLVFHLRRNDWLSSLCLAVAIVLKLTPAILLLYFIPFYLRRWQFVGKLITWCALLILLSFLVASPADWLGFIQSSKAGPPFRNFDSFWGTLDILGKFHPVFGSLKIVFYLLISIPLLIISLISIRHHNETDRPLYAFSLLILLSLFLSPLTWPHHYYLALLPYLYFPALYWSEGRTKRFKFYILLVFIALVNIPKSVVLPLGRYALIGIRAARTGSNFLAYLLSIRRFRV